MRLHQWLATIVKELGIAGTPGIAHAAHRDTFVLVHGALIGMTAWDHLGAPLRRGGGEVIQVELPAHGQDPLPADKATLDGYGDAIVQANGTRTGLATVTAVRLRECTGALTSRAWCIGEIASEANENLDLRLAGAILRQQ
jgi:hypothetical protein